MKTILFLLLGLVCATQVHATPGRVSPEEIAYYKPRLIIVVNKAKQGTAQDAQTLEAFLDGTLLYRATISTAKEDKVVIPPNERYPEGHTYYAGTYEGTFRIYNRVLDHKSTKWGGSRMEFAQFFDGGIAIHATTEEHYHELGRRASGGCVRMYRRDAKIMWKLVEEVSLDQTRIIVYDSTWTPHPLGRPGELPMYVLSKPVIAKKKPVVAKKKTPVVVPDKTIAPNPDKVVVPQTDTSIAPPRPEPIVQ
jgi:hypothetical protein